MKKALWLCLLLALYASVVIPLTAYLKDKPFVEKIGYTPQPEVMVLLSADQKQITSATMIMKVLVYFGGLVEKANRIYVPPDMSGMRRMIETSVKLDPYNMDSYYFAQAIMVWDMKEVRAANELLDYGMKYRDWDWYLPSFAGFNAAYFLHDYSAAANYYKRMAELTGMDLPMRLAGRYLYEAGRTDLAIAYMSALVQSTKNASIKKSLEVRLKAFQTVKRIEAAVGTYRRQRGRLPSSVDVLFSEGLLHEPAVDPYGGTFYLDKNGQVRTTSKFAFTGKKE